MNPKVSILIPCLNEEAFIEGVLDSLQQQEFPSGQLEILLIDGGSTDRTRAIIQDYQQRHSNIRLLENPARFVPQAMNIGIREAKGEIIIRMDAHAAYPPEYVRVLVDWLERSGAENVGGVWRIEPRSDHPKARAIADILAHPLGVGNSLFRIGVEEPQEVDTVPFGCYPREVFDRYGLYDERLQRNQDIELNKRIRRKGGRILLVPDTYSIYYARDTFRGLWKNNFATGLWVPLTIFFTKAYDSLSLRHFVPAFFVVYLFLCFGLVGKWLLGGMDSTLELLFSLPACLYLLLVMSTSVQLCRKQNQWNKLGYLLMGFPILHIAYGCGFLYGLVGGIWRGRP